MKRQTSILAGTALGLLMASAPLGANAQPFGIDMAVQARGVPANNEARPLILAQAEGEQTEEELRRQQEQQAPAEEAPPAAEEPAPQPQPEPQPEPEPEAAPAPEVEEPAQAPEPQVEEPAPQPDPAPEPAPDVEQPAPEPQAEQPAPEPAPEPETAPPPVDTPAAPEPEQPAQEAPEPEAPAEEPAPAPAEEPAPVPEAPAPAPEQPAGEAPAAPSQEEPAAPEAEQPAPADPSAPAAPSGEAPAPQPGEPAAPDAPAPADGAAQQPAEQAPPVNDGSAAPIFDSQKSEPQPAPAAPAPADGSQPQQPAQQAPAAEPVAPPADDGSAQIDLVRPAEIQRVLSEEGVRVERAPDAPFRRERPRNAEVVREVGDRTIIQINNQVIVQSNERPRMTRGARDVYYEDLPRGRTRETIEREDGTRVVTIRDEYGDVIRRSRIMPDDQEYVLFYVDEDNYDRGRDWRDPGLDLPPLRVDISAEDYILDAERVDDPEMYYTFLDQPPVERVQRLYSVDEVKRSARVRDMTRRVDLDTLTFEFGSASIAESEIQRLEGVANAMEKMMQKNPAETFLIEGHTDAVGSDVANLALSDRRAEAVADALTNVFGIPPENLATQGYGETYLKIRTQSPERENRRVAIRRITPLVAPIASAK
ncbi:OmpA family protein [Mesorhizobium sp. SB112]|uniref:OmpA family protein n=1 Tax=Mesorhizobium sp. SB112 TaxID=3151853 RepID=UPI0032634B97